MNEGYLYHIGGKECWFDAFGKPLNETGASRARASEKTNWHVGLGYELDPPNNGRTICRYMADEPVEVGLRAYVDWVFRHYYSGILSLWALSRQVPAAADRTMSISYEDMTEPGSYRTTANAMLDFLFDGAVAGGNNSSSTGKLPWYYHGKKPTIGASSNAAAHATPRDPSLRKRLADAIRQIDSEHYGNDIAWLDSVLPC